MYHMRCVFEKVSGFVLVLWWTGTWWSGDDDKKVREKEADIPWFTQKANTVLFLGLTLREKERKKDTGAKALMEQRCFNQHGVGIYTVLQGSYSQQR